MEDYKQKLEELVLKFYSPINVSGGHDLMTTSEVLHLVAGILPREPLSEHDVYEVLTALSFEITKAQRPHEDPGFFWIMNRVE